MSQNENIINDILIAFEQKKYNYAILLIEKYENEFSTYEGYPNLLNLKGYAFLFLNDHESAFYAFENSIKIFPDFSPAYIGISQIHLIRGEEEQALIYFQKAQFLNTNISETGIKLKQFEIGLIQNLTESLYISKQIALVESYLNLNQIIEAQKVVEETLFHNKINILLLNNFSIIFAKHYKLTEATNYIQKVLLIEPTNEIAISNLKIINNQNLTPPVEKREKIDIYLELNTYCNYLCIFCENDKIIEKKMISLSEIKGLDEMVKIAKMVDITGVGEITLHKEFKDILEYFTDRSIPVRFVTNGYNLTESIVDLIVESSVNELVISVNSLDKENYKYLMGKDGLEKVLKNIDYLTKHYKGVLEFSFVINKINLDEIGSFIDFGAKYKKHVALLGLTPTSNYPAELELDYNEETSQKLKHFKEYAKEKGISFWMFNFENQIDSTDRGKNLTDVIKSCDWVYKKFFVNANGDVSPCCWSKRIMGNIYKESFNEVWLGEKYNELRSLVARGDPKYCLKCRRAG